MRIGAAYPTWMYLPGISLIRIKSPEQHVCAIIVYYFHTTLVYSIPVHTNLSAGMPNFNNHLEHDLMRLGVCYFEWSDFVFGLGLLGTLQNAITLRT